MGNKSINSEWKKGSAELLLLSLIEAVLRHGYEIGKLIEQRSQGTLSFARRRLTRCSTGWRSAAGCKASGWKRAASGRDIWWAYQQLLARVAHSGTKGDRR